MTTTAAAYASGKTTPLTPLAYRVLWRDGLVVRECPARRTHAEAEQDRQLVQTAHPGCRARSVPLYDLTAEEREQIDAVAEEPEDQADLDAAREASIAARQAMIPPEYLGPHEPRIVVCPCCGNTFETATTDRTRCRSCRRVKLHSGGHHKRKESTR